MLSQTVQVQNFRKIYADLGLWLSSPSHGIFPQRGCVIIMTMHKQTNQIYPPSLNLVTGSIQIKVTDSLP